MPLENIVEILTDSFSPAIVLPKANTKIYYSALRHSFQTLSRHPPFSNLHPKDVVSIFLSTSTDSLDFLALLAVLNVRAIANPVDGASMGKNSKDVVDYLTALQPKLVLCGALDRNIDRLVAACNLLDIPLYSLQIDMHLRSLQLPKVVRKLTPLPQTQLSNVRPICNVARVGENLGLDSRTQTHKEYYKHDQHDLALLLQTKYSKKMVALTHLNILESLDLFSTSLSLTANDKTILSSNMPLSSTSGIMILLAAFFSGSSTIILPNPSSESDNRSEVENRAFWRTVKEFGVTWFLSDPTHHASLFKAFDSSEDDAASRNQNYFHYRQQSSSKAHSLRFLLSTGSQMDDELLLKMEQKYGTQVLTCYTATEAGFLITIHKPNSTRKLGSCGVKVIPLLIIGEDGNIAKPNVAGDILIGGPTVSQSYYLSHQNKDKDFFSFQGIRYLKSGDRGRLDERGFLTIENVDQGPTGLHVSKAKL